MARFGTKTTRAFTCYEIIVKKKKMVFHKKKKEGKEKLGGKSSTSPEKKAFKRKTRNGSSAEGEGEMVETQDEDTERIATITSGASGKKMKKSLSSTPSPKTKQKTAATNGGVKEQDQNKNVKINGSVGSTVGEKKDTDGKDDMNVEEKIDMEELSNGKDGKISDSENMLEDDDQQWLGSLVIDETVDEELGTSAILKERTDKEVDEQLLDDEDENLPVVDENIDQDGDDNESCEGEEMAVEEPKDEVMWKQGDRKKNTWSQKRGVVDQPLSVYKQDDDTVFLALAPHTSVYFQGIAHVRLLVGNVEISGYEMKKDEEQTVYSLISHSLQRLRAGEGVKISSIKKDVPEIPKDWIQKLNEVGKVIIVRMEHHFPPLAKLLYVAGWKSLVDQAEDEKYGLRSLRLINKKNSRMYPLYQESPEWGPVLENIKLGYLNGKVPCIVVIGGQKVGKSTFFRYIVNNLLSMQGSKGVLCLDLDPGQTELTMPTCLTFSHVKSPLLGPPYTHMTVGSSESSKQILIGTITPDFVMQKYLNAVQSLSTFCHNYESLPLVINTMGWTSGAGIDIMLDVIRITQPTHVFQIFGSKRHFNYPFVMDSETVGSREGGIVTEPGSPKLEYRLVPFNSISVLKLNMCTPANLREIAVLSHFSKIINQESKNKKSSMKGIVKVKWCDVVLHVFNVDVPREKTLQALNASLVTLCKVDPNDVVTISPHHPKQLVEDADFKDIIGWGIVRGIDPLTQELYVLTDLSEETVASSVNAIIMPELHLPTHAYTLFAESSDDAPYLEQSSKGKKAELMRDRVKGKHPKYVISKVRC
ncbi:polynucleotide 5'-hydroxyl-kinase NOL9-like isoform X2 [Penaeus japonicus]|uniref:polynucleotide 5'-hydroxyl-kinase NOL9-like isoform X2 n=1 Tax=Penaeus japonicus TaxID=27405 RepID=UPI001C70E6B7|nr:polynucleotide 5'-hydroxyl-kinase NOL9-like isoform X2 [Penaeus japonicus]